jgi:hypothetical protein
MRVLYHRPYRIALFIGLCTVVSLLASCAYQPGLSSYDPPGFWSGVIHGFLILFSFIGSLFTEVRIYAFPNSGSWYDFGYLLGATMFLGGGGAASARHEADEEQGSDFDI